MKPVWLLSVNSNSLFDRLLPRLGSCLHAQAAILQEETRLISCLAVLHQLDKSVQEQVTRTFHCVAALQASNEAIGYPNPWQNCDDIVPLS